jgi:hypothetical protein
MNQRERKVQEGAVVRRLTFGAGAAALGLAGYFTVSAATAPPLAIGIQPAADVQPPPAPAGLQEVSEKYFVRRVHVSALRPPAGGIQAAGRAPAAATVAQPVLPAQPAAQPAPAAAPPPTPRPVATTSGTPPK